MAYPVSLVNHWCYVTSFFSTRIVDSFHSNLVVFVPVNDFVRALPLPNFGPRCIRMRTSPGELRKEPSRPSGRQQIKIRLRLVDAVDYPTVFV